MRTWKEKSLSALLSAVMVLSLIPTASIPARAAVAVEKPDIDVSDTGKYFDAGIGAGASQALFVNGAFGDDPTIGAYNGSLTGNGKTADISAYNMMNCFGMYRKGSEVSKQVDGFSHDTGNNEVSINWGTGQYCETLNLCTYNDKGGKSGSLTVKIADNPTLKTLASSGGLQVYFNGYACAGKESRKAWPDDHTYVTGKVKITNGSNTVKEESSGKAKAQKRAFGTGGWVTLSENSVITISWSVDRSAGKFSNGWADKDVGIGDSVMLFRKVACPNIDDYTLKANGDYSTAGSRGAEVLLGNDGRIQLDMKVTLDGDKTKRDVVVSSLGGTKIPYSDDYNLLVQLGKRVLFNNTEGTGYTNQGEPVYMKLTSAEVLNTNGTVSTSSIADTDEARLEVLQGGISKLHYEWNASKGDYYGNNPIPGDGDWAGLVSSSNSLNLIDSIVLASFHDLAGNPLMLGGNLVPYGKSGTAAYTTNLLYEPATNYEEGTAYYYKEGDVYRLVTSNPGGTLGGGYYKRRNVLTGTVELNNTTLTDVGNPFAAGNSRDAGCGFVINAVTPTYSRSTNAVQPDVLTQLTLNHGDSFDIALNFSEIVKLREFKSSGSGNSTTATGYAPENLYLELNNGLRARYKSGMGTKQLIFTVSVPDMYTLTVAEPLTWATDYSKYYTKNSDGTYTQVTGTPAPDWAENKYYSKVDDVTGSNYLEISRMFVEDATTHAAAQLGTVETKHYKTYNGGTGTDTYSTADDYVLTDYVGNPVCEPIGQKAANSYDTTMAWAKLQVDNTKPQISIETTADNKYKVNVTENGSGVFHVANATQGGGQSSGVAYYVWVKNEDAQKACDAFVANNFEKVKRYSLAPSSADKVTVNGTTYGLTSCIPGTTIIEKPKGAGNWCLLAFTADMTWDSARQLIQYGKANYKTNPTGYLTTLGEKLGVQFDEMFEQVATQPENWATTYHNYYIKNADGTFSNISKGVEYPAWKAGVYYERKYTQLTEKPAGWDPYQEADNGTWKKLSDGRYMPIATGESVTTKYKYDDSRAYTKYYTKTENGDYVPVRPISGVPEWKSGTYYGYDQVTGITDSTDLSNYYVRDTDANGGAKYTKASDKYVPDFAPGGVYSKAANSETYTLVSGESAPENWNTTYSNYYYGVTEYKLYDEWKTTATVAADTYYTRSGDDPNYTYSEVTDNSWNAYETAGTYYTKDNTANPATYSPATVVPKFEANKFYSVSYVPVDNARNSETGKFKSYDEYGDEIKDGTENVWVDFEDIYGDLYTKNTENAFVPTTETNDPAYTANTYYRIVYGKTAVSTAPTDWATTYRNYATRTETYQQVTAEYPQDVKYYNGTELTLLSQKPADWNTAYYYYSTTDAAPDSYSPAQWVSAPAFAANTYYTYGFATLATKPENWPEVYTQYCYKNGNEYVKVDIASETQKTALAAKGVSILSAAPSFTGFGGRVYKAKEGSDFFVQKLAAKISDDTRKAAFTKDMLAASTDAAKIEVIRRYSAFVDDVYAADVAFMASAGGYANWTGNDYSGSDSNWVCEASDSVDLIAPTVTFESVTGDGSERVTIGVEVKDNKAVNTVKYQFVAADQASTITAETTQGWTPVVTGNAATLSFSASTTGDEENKTGGDYVLCVYAEDTAHNTTLEKQAVTVDKVESVQYSLTEPAGAKPYKEFAGVSATFYGTVYGDNIFARQFTVYAVIDDNATKAVDADNWDDEIVGTAAADVTKDGVTYAAKSYAMPEIKGVTGYYYLHIKYTYTSNGTTKSVVVNKPYWLEDNKAQIAINQTGSDEDGITVEITASGANSIEYAVTEINATKPTSGWTTYSNAFRILKSAHAGKNAVRVWARVNEDNNTARSADFLLSGGSMATGILANPDVELLDVVTEENDKRYAIVRFNKLGDNPATSALSVGAEYSVAVAAPNAATDSYVWQRWMPLDNMVKVKLGSGDARLLFKFRNGDAATTSNYPTLDVAATAAETNNAWTVATRSTLRVVNGDTGVTLTLQSKGDQPTTPLEAHANGVYEVGEGDNKFQAVVSNINNNPPSYSLVWSDGGEHTGENGAMATSVSVRLASDEDITVKSLTFNDAAVAPSRTYLFKQNGTAVFTFLNEAGVEATATAKVTWLDTEPWNLTVDRDYTGFTQYNNSIANGERLTVTSNKRLASLEINGTDVTDEMGLDITRNGTYQVSATTVSGQLVTKKIIVRDIVSSVTAPEKITVGEISNGAVTVTIKGTASASNPVYNGRKTENASPLELNENEYTITKRYTNNGTYTEYVTDSVGNVASYQVKVSVFDTTAPVIKLNNGNKAITKPQTDTDEGANWIKNALTITDDKTAKENIAVELEGTVDTSKVGAYSVLVKAKDAKNNQSMLRVTVYVLPTDGMLVTDQNGVLFCSQSKDAALVTRNGEKQVKLTVQNYDWVELLNTANQTKTRAHNAKATLSVTVKQGAFREGQMKYFDTVATGKIAYNTNDRTATITLDVKDLPGTGWYTVLIRNSEREREFTTFFINADN